MQSRAVLFGLVYNCVHTSTRIALSLGILYGCTILQLVQGLCHSMGYMALHIFSHPWYATHIRMALLLEVLYCCAILRTVVSLANLYKGVILQTLEPGCPLGSLCSTSL